MNAPDRRSLESLAPLVEAILHTDTNLRKVLFEKLTRDLIDDFPATARSVAASLHSFGDADGATLAGLIIKELGPLADQYRLESLRTHQMMSENADQRLRVDVLILSVKEVELIACLRAFGVESGVRPQAVTKRLDVWLVQSEEQSIGIVNIGQDGNVESALKMASALAVVDFDLAVLIGMAAGVEGEVSPGDVVVAEQVWAVDFEVVRPNGASAPRPKTFPTSTETYERLPSFRQVDPTWAGRIAGEVLEWVRRDPESCEVPEDLDGGWRPRYKSGVVFAGSRLIEDGSLPDLRASTQARLLAAEMEGAGFAAACREVPTLRWLVVRGIADFGRLPRLKDWQFAATYAAAALVRDALRAGLLTTD